jgi:hypothetical protein
VLGGERRGILLQTLGAEQLFADNRLVARRVGAAE